MDCRVEVWGKPLIVNVDQKSETVWIAVGQYLGNRIETTGRTASDAVSAWRAAAHYQGN